MSVEPNEDWRSDPVLGLLPEDVPLPFLTMPPEEQAWRGRYYLVAWAAGYEIGYAWWLALNDEPHHVAGAHDTLSRVADSEIPRMMAARRAQIDELARQAALGGQ